VSFGVGGGNSFLSVVFLATLFAVHTFHRPYWPYYDLHFCIALAWLASVALAEVSNAIWHYQWIDLRRQPFRTSLACIVWAVLVALMIQETPSELYDALGRLSMAESATDNAIVQEMREYRTQTRWAFTDQVIYAFHAGLKVPSGIGGSSGETHLVRGGQRKGCLGCLSGLSTRADRAIWVPG